MTGARRGGLSMLEVLITSVLLVILLGSLVLLFGNANRVSYSADRAMRATMHGQVLLEAISQLPAGDAPLPAAPGEVVLHDDASGVTAPGQGRWDEVRAYLESPLPFAMNRRVLATRLEGGRVVLRVDMSWQALPGKPETQRRLTVELLASPALWQ